MCSKAEAREAMEARSKAIDFFLEVCTDDSREVFPIMQSPLDCVGFPLRTIYEATLAEGITAPFRALLERLR